MKLLLAELAPRRGELEANLARIESIVHGRHADLLALPELFLTGYRVGDRLRQLALRRDSPEEKRLVAAARELGGAIVTGAVTPAGRPGEIQNAAVLVGPDGVLGVQPKRYLPTFGPFEEGTMFTPGATSTPIVLGNRRVGLAICYDAFFPEIARPLALAGAELVLYLSAAPVTSRTLFDRILPARAIENALPVAYVNRVGVEDGLVFGGGSGAWNARGDPLVPLEPTLPDAGDGERLLEFDLDLDEGARWRPFRPVLRDAGPTWSEETPLPSAPSPEL